jgi:hypothetical protein
MCQWVAAAAGECFLLLGFHAQVFASLLCTVSLTMFMFPFSPTRSGGGGGGGAAAGGAAVEEEKEEEVEEEAEIGGGMDMFGGDAAEGGDY